MATARQFEEIATDMAGVTWAARTLEVGEQTVRRWEKRGLLPAVRLPDGTRIFQRSAIERIAAERAKTRAGR